MYVYDIIIDIMIRDYFGYLSLLADNMLIIRFGVYTMIL